MEEGDELETPSAILLPSLAPDLAEDVPVPIRPTAEYSHVWKEAQRWQMMSSVASRAESASAMAGVRGICWTVHESDGTDTVVSMQGKDRPREANRVLEIHGLMGSIGEQLMLAWAAEQDVQRVELSAGSRRELVTTMLGRAHAELSSHFILGASHSLANLALRVLLLDTQATATFAQVWGKRYAADAFAPLSNDRNGWLTLNKSLVDALRRAAAASSSQAMKTMVESVCGYYESSAYAGLDDRRGLDYHRHRPQSVPHTAPHEGTWSKAGDSVRLVAPRRDPASDLTLVHSAITCGLEALADTMHEVSEKILTAIGDQNIPTVTRFATMPEGEAQRRSSPA